MHVRRRGCSCQECQLFEAWPYSSPPREEAMDEIERCARAMGMKPHREVQEVVPVDGGHAARTHDGQWTLVRDDGTMRPCDAPEPVAERDSGTAESKNPGPAPVGEQGPEPVTTAKATKVTAAKRDRS